MWEKSPEPFILQQEQVHVWKATVPQFNSSTNQFLTLLSNDEKERAAKFRFKKDRVTYVVGKGLLRTLLEKYLNCTPSSIQFKYNEQSKPFFPNALDLQFNVSHSHEAIVFAFVLKHDIGVDVEYNKRVVEVPQIAKRFFSKNEANTLLMLPESEWLSTFYNCWTRKEAFIKAKGGGLSIPLDQFEVSLTPDSKPELKHIEWDRKDVENWKMKTICDNEYTGAIIVNCKGASFNFYNCDYLL